ncbi:MAG: gliding motility lipoprotein GldH [Saprospiraceae bacterium]|nr:gliding motility lipoprotein GldH [Saprospiraceae bacterium]
MSIQLRFWDARILTLLACACLFFACTDPYLYNEKQTIPNGNWSYADTLNFKVQVNDTAALYNLFIAFEYADTFPNQNVYLKLSTRFPDGKRAQRTKSFDLFDFGGNPIGKCSGKWCTQQTLLQNNLYFNQLGEHMITLEQFTRKNPLPGIKSISLQLEKTDKKR